VVFKLVCFEWSIVPRCRCCAGQACIAEISRAELCGVGDNCSTVDFRCDDLASVGIERVLQSCDGQVSQIVCAELLADYVNSCAVACDELVLRRCCDAIVARVPDGWCEA